VTANRKNKTRWKSLDRFENDPRVVEIWIEHEDEGIWMLLADGYKTHMGTQTLRRDNVTELLRSMWMIRKQG